MTEIEIQANAAGQRLDKYLKKVLKTAPDSFLYKMLRKKNILLNGGKASGAEKLQTGDHLQLYLSEETILKFQGESTPKPEREIPDLRANMIYENDHILVLNKPVGMLSQKADAADISVVECVTDYLRKTGVLSETDLQTFHPAVCNRLDRNTSGLIIAGKTQTGLREMSKLLRKRTLQKYYLCLVKGKITEEKELHGFLEKDPDTNRVTITENQTPTNASSPIHTAYIPLASSRDLTLLKVHLLTGKPHQIRAHLASDGHPLVGDYKYGSSSLNEWAQKKYGVQSQLLHAYELQFPNMADPLEDLSKRTLKAPVPAQFYTVIKETTWELGTQEALEVLH